MGKRKGLYFNFEKSKLARSTVPFPREKYPFWIEWPFGFPLSPGIAQQHHSHDAVVFQHQLAVNLSGLILHHYGFHLPLGIQIPGGQEVDANHLEGIGRNRPRIGSLLARHVGPGHPTLLHRSRQIP